MFQFCPCLSEIYISKRTHIHSPPHLVLYVRTVLCENQQRFLLVTLWLFRRTRYRTSLYQTCSPWRVLTGISWWTIIKPGASYRTTSMPHTHTERCWSEMAPDYCMITAAACYWWDNRPVPCKNYWATLRTLACFNNISTKQSVYVLPLTLYEGRLFWIYFMLYVARVFYYMLYELVLFVIRYTNTLQGAMCCALCACFK